MKLSELFMRHGQDEPPCLARPSRLHRQAGRLHAQTQARLLHGCRRGRCPPRRRHAGHSFLHGQLPEEFARIVDYFVAQYTAGRTPNPCIVCNTWLKFGKLFEYADRLGAEFVATGHYARLVSPPDGEIALCRGHDPSKDQSYVLFGVPRRLLPRLMFPVGEHRKEEIRAMAERLGLHVAAKRDSQEICFVPEEDHARFIRQRRGAIDTSGEIVTTSGVVVGRHAGFEQFTVGQRKGLRLAFGEPRYVVRIEADSRRVVIGTHDELAQNELIAGEANWLVEEGRVAGGGWRGAADETVATSGFPVGAAVELPHQLALHPSPPATLCFRAQVKIRYRSRPADATLERLPGGKFQVCFDRPCYGIAPGQAAVCYLGDRVLGGGWIE